MLVRLLYVSQPVGPITTTTTTLILEKSSAYNKKRKYHGCFMPRLRLVVASLGRREISSQFALRSHHGR